MIAAVGDLVEDVVVRLHGEIRAATDTPATVVRRRGGSAANVVEAVCRAGGRARFIGQVGDDAIGAALCADLVAVGADVAVRRRGRTGTVIALLDAHGERTMLSDRASAVDLADPDPVWLDGVTALHVPFYSLAVDPLASTTRTLAGWAHERGALVSVDTSSTSVLAHFGEDAALAAIAALAPRVVLANEMEASALAEGLDPQRLGAAVVVKRGPAPALVRPLDGPEVVVAAPPLSGVADTTGAGDAFAAGLLLALVDGADLVGAVRRGHEVAGWHLRRLATL